LTDCSDPEISFESASRTVCQELQLTTSHDHPRRRPLAVRHVRDRVVEPDGPLDLDRIGPMVRPTGVEVVPGQCRIVRQKLVISATVLPRQHEEPDRCPRGPNTSVAAAHAGRSLDGWISGWCDGSLDGILRLSTENAS
jgi:hypothetical protein